MFDQGANALEEKELVGAESIMGSESAVARSVARQGEGVPSPGGDEIKCDNRRAEDAPTAMPPLPIAYFRNILNDATLDRTENRRAVCFLKAEERAARSKALQGGIFACKKATSAKVVLRRALDKEKASIAALKKAEENLVARVEWGRKHRKANKQLRN